MTTIQIDQETVDGLTSQAKALGISLPDYLRMIATNGDGPAGTQSFEEWSARLRAWAASFPKTDHFVDDDRGSIYAGRSE